MNYREFASKATPDDDRRAQRCSLAKIAVGKPGTFIYMDSNLDDDRRTQTAALVSARCHLAGCHTVSLTVRRSLEWNGAVKCFRDSTVGTLAAILRSLQVTRPGFTSVIQKQSISHRSGYSLMMIDLSKWKEQKSVGNNMVLTFYAAGGHVATIPLEHQRTVTAQWNTTVALPQVSKKQRKAPKSWTEGHPVASAMPPIWQMIFWEGLLCSCWPILLTVQTWHPGDFFLFPMVKVRLHGKRFSTLEDAVAAYQEELCALDDSDWRQCFDSWFMRMRRCIMFRESTLRKCNGKISIIVLNCCVSKNFLRDFRN